MAEAIGMAILASATSSAAVVAAAEFLVFNAAAINAGLAIAASTAYSASNAAAQRRRARNAYNDSLKDREVMIRTGTAPRRVIYGRDRVSGPVVYAESTGTNKEYLHLVVALAAHECDAIESIYFNDVLLPTPDGSGNINSGEFAKTSTIHELQVVTTNVSGVATLTYAATRITGVSIDVGSGIDMVSSQVTGYSHTAGASTVSGLTASTTYSIAYERTLSESLVRVKKYLGTSTQTADADLVAESASKWTTNHRGRGICYLYVRLKYDQDVFGSVGVPNITCVVKGKKVYDPRSGLTVWSNNAALVAADFLKDSTYGLGATSGQVPDSELTTAANVCDENVNITVSTTQKRYTFDGSYTTDVSPLDVLEGMAGAMAGAVVWTQGRWYVRPGAYRTPSVTIDADSLADGGLVTMPKPSRSELFNAVRVVHRDPDRKYVEAQAPLVTNATYQTQDGGRQIVREMRLPIACEPKRAQRLAKIELERSRQALTVKLRCSLKAYDLAPTDTVYLTLSRYGWSAKVFEVIARTWNGATLEYTLRETASGVFDWAYGEATTVDLAPDTTLPNPYTAPAAIADISTYSDSSMIVRTAGGTVVSRAYCSWPAVTEQFVLRGGWLELEWRRTRDARWVSSRLPGDATEGWLEAVPNGDAIAVRVRPVNSLGKAGPWTYGTHTVNGIGGIAAQGVYLETFSDGYGTWRSYGSSTGEMSVVSVTDSVMGGKALRVGNNSGDDMRWLISDASVPYDPAALYRIRVRVRRTAGTATLYAGFAGVAADGVTLVNRTGANDYGSQHYLTAAGVAPGSSWTVYDGYLSGTAGTGSTGANNDPASPGAAHTNVRFIRPLLILNYNAAAGTMEVDYVEIAKVRQTTDIAPGAATSVVSDENQTATASWSRPGTGFNTVTYNVLRQISYTNNEAQSVTVEISGGYRGTRTAGAGTVKLGIDFSTTSMTSTAATDDGGRSSGLPDAASGTVRCAQTYSRSLAAGSTMYAAAICWIATAASTTTSMSADDIDLRIVGIKR